MTSVHLDVAGQVLISAAGGAKQSQKTKQSHQRAPCPPVEYPEFKWDAVTPQRVLQQ